MLRMHQPTHASLLWQRGLSSNHSSEPGFSGYRVPRWGESGSSELWLPGRDLVPPPQHGVGSQGGSESLQPIGGGRRRWDAARRTLNPRRSSVFDLRRIGDLSRGLKAGTGYGQRVHALSLDAARLQDAGTKPTIVIPKDTGMETPSAEEEKPGPTEFEVPASGAETLHSGFGLTSASGWPGSYTEYYRFHSPYYWPGKPSLRDSLGTRGPRRRGLRRETSELEELGDLEEEVKTAVQSVGNPADDLKETGSSGAQQKETTSLLGRSVDEKIFSEDSAGSMAAKHSGTTSAPPDRGQTSLPVENQVASGPAPLPLENGITSSSEDAHNSETFGRTDEARLDWKLTPNLERSSFKPLESGNALKSGSSTAVPNIAAALDAEGVGSTKHGSNGLVPVGPRLPKALGLSDSRDRLPPRGGVMTSAEQIALASLNVARTRRDAVLERISSRDQVAVATQPIGINLDQQPGERSTNSRERTAGAKVHFSLWLTSLIGVLSQLNLLSSGSAFPTPRVIVLVVAGPSCTNVCDFSAHLLVALRHVWILFLYSGERVLFVPLSSAGGRVRRGERGEVLRASRAHHDVAAAAVAPRVAARRKQVRTALRHGMRSKAPRFNGLNPNGRFVEKNCALCYCSLELALARQATPTDQLWKGTRGASSCHTICCCNLHISSRRSTDASMRILFVMTTCLLSTGGNSSRRRRRTSRASRATRSRRGLQLSRSDAPVSSIRQQTPSRARPRSVGGHWCACRARCVRESL